MRLQQTSEAVPAKIWIRMLPRKQKVQSKERKKIIKNLNHQMSNFKAKMRKIRYRLGLCSIPRRESLRCSPGSPRFNRSLFLGRRGMEGMEIGRDICVFAND